MLTEFWSDHATYGFHPEDIPCIADNRVLKWSIEDALAHTDSFGAKSALDKLLHANLFPFPFIGNIKHASVVILFGNPGVVPTDYLDEQRNPPHMQACRRNLLGQAESFIVLERDSIDTGGHRYWLPRFKKLVDELARALSITQHQAFRVATRWLLALSVLHIPKKKTAPGTVDAGGSVGSEERSMGVETRFVDRGGQTMPSKLFRDEPQRGGILLVRS